MKYMIFGNIFWVQRKNCCKKQYFDMAAVTKLWIRAVRRRSSITNNNVTFWGATNFLPENVGEFLLNIASILICQIRGGRLEKVDKLELNLNIRHSLSFCHPLVAMWGEIFSRIWWKNHFLMGRWLLGDNGGGEMGESGKRGNLADAIELSSSHCLKSTFLIKAISIIPKIA